MSYMSTPNILLWMFINWCDPDDYTIEEIVEHITELFKSQTTTNKLVQKIGNNRITVFIREMELKFV